MSAQPPGPPEPTRDAPADRPLDPPFESTRPPPPAADPVDTVTYPCPAAGRPADGHFPEVPGYDILAEIGRGGMGVVYRARDVKLNREVALKMVLGGPAAGLAAVHRFLAEAEALAALRHPNVVQVYDLGMYQGLPYFTMEFCPGGSLAAGADRLSPRDAAALVAGLARGVAAAHAAGVLHRDLKPDNVLLAADGTPKVSDFGLAKRLDDAAGLTQVGTVLGTPSYMAPEQAAGAAGLTTAADVYGLGAILYYLLTGGPPFRAATVRETIGLVLEAAPAGPRARNPAVDRDLEAVCLKCLRKAPADRYESAAALAADLDRWKAGEPTKARPLSVLERTTRWLRQNARGMSLVVAFGLIWGAASGIAVARVQLTMYPDWVRSWPKAPLHPMAWVAAARTDPAIGYTVSALALLLPAGGGWVVTLGARPRAPGQAYGFAAAAGLLAGLVTVLFVSPLSMTYSMPDWHGVKRRPVADWRAAAADPGHPARRDLDYLRPWLPPDRRNLDYPGWEADVAVVADRLAATDSVERVYFVLWLAVAIALPAFLALAVLSTWAVGLATRRPGGPVRTGLRYVEHYVPAFLAVAAGVLLVRCLVALGMWNLDPDNRRLTLVTLPYTAAGVVFAGTALAVGYRGRYRDWPWHRRGLAYLIGLLTAGLVLWVGAIVAR